MTQLVLKASYSMPEKFDIFKVQLANNQPKSQIDRDRVPNLTFISRRDVDKLFNLFQFPHIYTGDKIFPSQWLYLNKAMCVIHLAHRALMLKNDSTSYRMLCPLPPHGAQLSEMWCKLSWSEKAWNKTPYYHLVFSCSFEDQCLVISHTVFLFTTGCWEIIPWHREGKVFWRPWCEALRRLTSTAHPPLLPPVSSLKQHTFLCLLEIFLACSLGVEA